MRFKNNKHYEEEYKYNNYPQNQSNLGYHGQYSGQNYPNNIKNDTKYIDDNYQNNYHGNTSGLNKFDPSKRSNSTSNRNNGNRDQYKPYKY